MVYLHSNRKVTKKEVRPRWRHIAVTSLAKLLFDRMWKVFGLWTRKIVECCKKSFIYHLIKTLENSSTETSVNCGGLAQEVIEENNINCWTRHHSCDNLTNNVSVF